jgi:hypothetical protein
MAFQIYEHLVVGQLQGNCYLVGDPETNQAVVIGGRAAMERRVTTSCDLAVRSAAWFTSW